MTDNQSMTLIDAPYMPVMGTRQALQRYQSFKEFVEGVLKKGVDYGVIPGASKPSLQKPGAEKLATFFGLAPVFEDVAAVEDWTGEAHGGEAMFYYRQKCKLFRNDRLVGSADGSCNSREKKYRWRESQRKCPTCGKTTIIKGKAEYGGGWLCFKKTGGCGAKFGDNDPQIVSQAIGRVPNEDIADQVNTILKMAQKRALVAAVLIATNASEYFTQDIEDYIEGTFSDAPQQPAATGEKVDTKTGEIIPPATPPPPTGQPPLVVVAPRIVDADGWRAFCREHGFSREDIEGVLGTVSVVPWTKEHNATLDDAAQKMLDWASKRQPVAGV